jgi:hypothetical protein
VARAAARIQSEHFGRVLDVGALPDGSPFTADAPGGILSPSANGAIITGTGGSCCVVGSGGKGAAGSGGVAGREGANGGTLSRAQGEVAGRRLVRDRAGPSAPAA